MTALALAAALLTDPRGLTEARVEAWVFAAVQELWVCEARPSHAEHPCLDWLGLPRWADRERASAFFRVLGPLGTPVLARGLCHRDPEVRHRSALLFWGAFRCPDCGGSGARPIHMDGLPDVSTWCRRCWGSGNLRYTWDGFAYERQLRPRPMFGVRP
jgi:hypothetical protein